MKNANRMLALLLSLIMVLGLFPAAAFAADTAVIDVYITETAPTVNGVPGENGWYVDHRLSAVSAEGAPVADAGFMWNENGLFVAVHHDGAETMTLSTGGKTATYDLALGAFTENWLDAQCAVSGETAEFFLPFSGIGVSVSEFDQQVAFGLSVTDAAGTAALPESTALCMRGSVLFAADGCDDLDNAGYVDGAYYGTRANVAITQEDSYYHMSSKEKGDDGNAIRREINNPGGPMDVVFTVKINSLATFSTNYAWRGFFFETRGIGDVRRCTLNKESDGTIYFNMLYDFTDANGTGTSNRTATTLKEGDTATFRIEYAADKTAKVYINGELLTELPAMTSNRTKAPTNCVEMGIGHYNWSSGATDVELYGYQITRPLYNNDQAVVDTLFNTLTFDDIKGLNNAPDEILNDLTLPGYLTVPYVGEQIALSWSSDTPASISNEGEFVHDSIYAADVILTASLLYNGQTYTKEFALSIPAYDPNGCVMYLVNDVDPYTGRLLSKGITTDLTLDQTLTSIGYDMGTVTRVNQVVLTDDDGLSRLFKENLSLYVSDDNVTYRRVRDWTLFRAEDRLILANFDETCRYVKVHCTLEDTADAGFTNMTQNLMQASYTETLPGAGGGEFTLLDKVQVTSEALEYDAVAYLQPEAEGELRFVSGGKVLNHYYDGSGWFIRVPEINGSAIVEIWGGNESALNLSNVEGVFENVYGNRTVQDLTVGEFKDNLKVRQMPNGDIIAIANKVGNPCEPWIRRSTDGGRTWTDPVPLIEDNESRRCEGGSFLVDGDTVWYLYYSYKKFVSSDMTASDCKIVLLRSDDCGVSWSEPYVVDTGRPYSLSYSNGLKLSCFDGEGENVDYVFPYHFQSSNDGSFHVSAFYSTDGGATWVTSESSIDYAGPSGHEGGPTEAAISELSDGTLRLLMRCQYNGVYWLCTTTSTDHGVTWNEQAEKTNIASSNTMPVLAKFDVDGDGDLDDVLEWGGNNLLGAKSYARYPLTLAWSDDDMVTWKQKLNVYAGTSYATYTGTVNNVVQPDLTLSNYMGGDDALLAWWNNWATAKTILIEDYTDYLYKTSGAGDTFETTSAAHEGWLDVAASSASLSSAYAAEGSYSLKIDDSVSTVARADRSIPAMTKGEISFDVYFESLTSGFAIELKSAFAKAHLTGDVLMAIISADGTVKDRNTALSGFDGDTVLGTMDLTGWNRITIKFDMANNVAEFYANGVKLGNMTFNFANGESITNVQLSDVSSQNNQMVAYIDNFVATRGVTLTVSEAPAEPELFDLYGANMKLSSDLTMNFFVAKANITGEGWYAEIVRGENVTKINLADCETSGDYYKIVYPGFAAKEMTDEVVVTIYDANGNAVSNPWTDSIRAYAMRVFEKENKTLLVDMLNYGAAAQTHFGYNTDDLANALLTDEQKAYGSQSVTLENKQVAGENFYGASLSLKSILTLNLYFVNVTEDMTAVITYTNHNGEAKEFEKAITMNGSYGVVTLTELALADCREPVTCTIVDADGNEIASVTDSIESYCARTLDDQPLNEPLMKFCQSAWNTFH